MSNLQELLNRLGYDNQYTRGVTKGLSDVLGGDEPRQEFQSVMSDGPRSNEDSIRDIVSATAPFAVPALGAMPKLGRAMFNYPRTAGLVTAPLFDDPSAAFLSPLGMGLMYAPDADASKFTDSMKLIDKFVAAHGTPHVFPPHPDNPLGKFDMSKMSTGEGVQAFMKGHYLSGDENISRVHYRDRLTEQINNNLDPLKWRRDAAADRLLTKQNEGVTAAAAEMAAKRIERAGGDPLTAWDRHIKKPIGDKIADDAFKMGYGDVYLPAAGVRNARLKRSNYVSDKTPTPVTDLMVNHFGKMDPDAYYTKDTLKQLRSLDTMIKKKTEAYNYNSPWQLAMEAASDKASKEYAAAKKAADPSYQFLYHGPDKDAYHTAIDDAKRKALTALPEEVRSLKIEHPLLPNGGFTYERDIEQPYPALGGHLITGLMTDIKRGIPLKVARDKALQGQADHFSRARQDQMRAEALKALEAKYPLPDPKDRKVGALYSVLVNESPANMLPLDMLLAEMQQDLPEVYEKFKRAYGTVDPGVKFDEYVTGMRTPRQLHDALYGRGGQAKLSEELNNLGVQGNLHLNSGRRNLQTNREFDPKAFNYVLFNDEVPTIIDRELGGTLRPGKAHGGLLQIANSVENEQRQKMAGGGLIGAGKRMAKYLAGAADDVPRALKRTEIIKEPGGNWLAGNPDVRNLRKYFDADDLANTQETLKIPIGSVIPDRGMPMSQTLKDMLIEDERVFKNAQAQNRVIDKKLVPYVKNQMGSIQDPIRESFDAWPAEKAARKAKAQARLDTLQGKTARLMAEKGVPEEYLTAHRQEILAAQKNLDLVEANKGSHLTDVTHSTAPSNRMATRRKNAGFPPLGVGKSDEARAWENMADDNINRVTAGKLISSADKYIDSKSALRENPWISKLDPKTPTYSVEPGSLHYEGGFSHMMDEIFNALQDGKVTPEQLEKMNIQQMSRMVGDINAERVVNASHAAFADAQAMPLHKEYPSGHSWRQLRKPDTDVPLPEGMGVEEVTPGNFKYFWPDQYDGHKKYSPPMNSIEEATTAAQDRAKHQVLQKWLTNEGNTMAHCVGGYCDSVAAGDSQIYSLRGPDGRPGVTIETKPAAKAPEPWRVTQIKGQGNRKAADEFQPMIEDFLRSGKWSDIKDRDYTNLTPEQFDEILGVRGFAGGGILGAGKRIAKYMVGAADDVPRAVSKPEVLGFNGAASLGIPRYEDMLYKELEAGGKMKQAGGDPRMRGTSGNSRAWTGADLRPRLEMPTQGFKPRSLAPIEKEVPLDQALQMEPWLPKAYPDLLNDYKVRQTMSEPLGSGSISYGKGLITVGMDPSGLSLQDQAALIANPRKKELAMMQTMGHELLGHGIADIERFTPGSSPNAMRKLLLSTPDLEARKEQQMLELLMDLANGADPMKTTQDYARRNPELKKRISQLIQNFDDGMYSDPYDLRTQAGHYASSAKGHMTSLDKRNTIENIVNGDLSTYAPPSLLSAAKKYGQQKGLGPLDEKAFLGYRTNSGENEAELIAKRMDQDMFYKDQYPLVTENFLLNKYLHNISR